MTPTPFLALLLWPKLWRDARVALLVAMVSAAFGATAALHLSSGSPVLLAVVATLPLFWHAARTAGGMPPQCKSMLAAMLALVVWAALLTAFAPRLLADAVGTIAIVSRGAHVATELVPLAPQPGNLNQMLYLVWNGGVVWAVSAVLGRQMALARVADALLAVSAANLGLAFLQALHLYGGLPNLLEPVVNAGYAIHMGGSIGGLHRLSGAFPEASSFAGFTLALHAACRALARAGHRPRLASGLSLGLLAVLLLSTSATGYVGLALFYGLLGVHGLALRLRHPHQIRVGAAAAGVLAMVCAALLALLLAPALQDGVATLVDKTLFDKVGSASGRERSFWNATAWQAFVDTFGLGIGAGSTRASSFPLVLMSNLGAVGLVLFITFIHQTAGRAVGVRTATPAALAAAHGMLAMLAAATVSATVLDLGVFFYLLAGVAGAAGQAAPAGSHARAAGHARTSSRYQSQAQAQTQAHHAH